MADVRLELAYEAVVKLLSTQDSTLSNLRNRATGLLSVAALIMSFSATLGIINTDPDRGPLLPSWAGILLLVVLIAIGVAVMVVLWPIRKWGYGVDPGATLRYIAENQTEDAVRNNIVVAALDVVQRNQKGIERRGRSYRLAVVLITVEVIVLVIALLLRR